MKAEDLQKLKETETEILEVVDRYCHRYNIRYSLYAGTALGAVRHKGFIPWDDDIDIAMTREEFNRFCATWRRQPVQGYTLSCLQYDDVCSTCHAKIYKDNTLFIEEGMIEGIGHNGIWVDIFPLDKVGDANSQKKVFRAATELILLSRANTRSRIDTINKRIIRQVVALIPKTIRKKRIRSILRWLAWNDKQLSDSDYKQVSLSATYAFRYRFPKEMTDHTVKIEFEGRDFDIYSKYEEMLTIIYGDYMQLPPESERVCKHDPQKLKF